MRKIKFRMWDFENKEMIDGESLAFEEYAPISHLLSQKGIMQYTGLTDRNGKEIYEGDIITQKRMDKPYSDKAKSKMVDMLVEWYDGYSHHRTEKALELNPIAKENKSWFNERPMFIARSIERETKFHYHDWSEFHNCEVIGNIYEHPHLIEVS